MSSVDPNIHLQLSIYTAYQLFYALSKISSEHANTKMAVKQRQLLSDVKMYKNTYTYHQEQLTLALEKFKKENDLPMLGPASSHSASPGKPILNEDHLDQHIQQLCSERIKRQNELHKINSVIWQLMEKLRQLHSDISTLTEFDTILVSSSTSTTTISSTSMTSKTSTAPAASFSNPPPIFPPLLPPGDVSNNKTIMNPPHNISTTTRSLTSSPFIGVATTIDNDNSPSSSPPPITKTHIPTAAAPPPVHPPVPPPAPPPVTLTNTTSSNTITNTAKILHPLSIPTHPHSSRILSATPTQTPIPSNTTITTAAIPPTQQ